MNQREPSLLRKPWVRIALAIAVFVSAGIGWEIYRIAYILRGLRDAYAMWDTGTLLIDHLKTHGGQWPSGWDDLDDSYVRLQLHHSADDFLRGGMTMDELRQRIGIDWHVNPETLASARASQPGRRRLRFVWPLDGNTTLWAGADPNELISRFIRERGWTTARDHAAVRPIKVMGRRLFTVASAVSLLLCRCPECGLVMGAA